MPKVNSPHLHVDRSKQVDPSAIPPVLVQIHDYDLPSFANVAAGFGCESFAYVVTPNVDHLIRFCDDPSFRALYSTAGFILNDSRVLSWLANAYKDVKLPVCTGSDLTEMLFAKIIKTNDRIVLIGSNAVQAKALEQLYGLNSLNHFEPPMGFIHDAEAVEVCLRFIEAQSPFRFCFLAVGCPQQEILANKLQQRGVARGLAFCIGASINFLTGTERRAPPVDAKGKLRVGISPKSGSRSTCETLPGSRSANFQASEAHSVQVAKSGYFAVSRIAAPAQQSWIEQHWTRELRCRPFATSELFSIVIYQGSLSYSAVRCRRMASSSGSLIQGNSRCDCHGKEDK